MTNQMTKSNENLLRFLQAPPHVQNEINKILEGKIPVLHGSASSDAPSRR